MNEERFEMFEYQIFAEKSSLRICRRIEGEKSVISVALCICGFARRVLRIYYVRACARAAHARATHTRVAEVNWFYLRRPARCYHSDPGQATALSATKHKCSRNRDAKNCLKSQGDEGRLKTLVSILFFRFERINIFQKSIYIKLN